MPREKKTEIAKRQIIQYICDHKLKIDDRLPNCAFFRNDIGVGSTVISRALNELADDGVLQIKNRGGVFVKDVTADGHICRNIGVVYTRIPGNFFSYGLGQFISSELHDHNCRQHHFLRSHDGVEAQEGFEQYLGLKRNLEHKLIDGLISLVTLSDEVLDLCRSKAIPVCQVCWETLESNSVSLDISHLLEESFRLIVKKHLSRPLFMCYGPPLISQVQALLEKYQTWFKGWDMEKGIAFFIEHDHSPRSMDYHQWAIKMIEHLGSLPPHERPDVLFMWDDVLSNWVQIELLKHRHWQPELITSKTVHFPDLSGDCGCGHWAIDPLAWAQLSVKQLLRMVQRKELAFTPVFYRPELILHQGDRSQV